MPASAAPKRMRGKRIERAFIIGNEAWPIPKPGQPGRPSGIPDEFTKGWRMYLETPDGQPDISTWLKKVSFKIFETYKNPTRVFEEPPFEVREHGWGEFVVEIKMYFQPVVGAKPETRQHYLRVDPYGDDAHKQYQIDTNLVINEAMEIIEFNEPTEALWEALTDEDQFKRGTAVKRRRKAGHNGVFKEPANVPASQMSCELPDDASNGNSYNKTAERELLKLLDRSKKELDAEAQKVKKQIEEAHATKKQLEEERKQLEQANGAS